VGANDPPSEKGFAFPTRELLDSVYAGVHEKDRRFVESDVGSKTRSQRVVSGHEGMRAGHTLG